MKPNYTRIYLDLIKYKNKEQTVSKALIDKINNIRIVKDILDIEKELFKNEDLEYNQKLKCYDESTVKVLLDHQKANNLTNVEIGNKYKISRNTIAKWKKIYNE